VPGIEPRAEAGERSSQVVRVRAHRRDAVPWARPDLLHCAPILPGAPSLKVPLGGPPAAAGGGSPPPRLRGPPGKRGVGVASTRGGCTVCRPVSTRRPAPGELAYAPLHPLEQPAQRATTTRGVGEEIHDGAVVGVLRSRFSQQLVASAMLRARVRRR